MSKYREVQNRLNQILERADVGDRVSRSIDLFLTGFGYRQHHLHHLGIRAADLRRPINTVYMDRNHQRGDLHSRISLPCLGRTEQGPWPVWLCCRVQSACQIHAQLQWPCGSFVHPALLSTRVFPLFRSADFARFAAASHSEIVSLQFGYGRSV